MYIFFFTKKRVLVLSVGIALTAILMNFIDVSATHVEIDSNLTVSPNIISFSTVFPGEVHFKPLTVDLSDQFLASPIHDDVEYRILQKPKPRTDTPEERAYCAAYPNDFSRCYPSLCPYLSKTADDTPPNDTSVPAFHDPDAPSSITYGRLAKSDNDTEDNWLIDLHTPCFKGQCDQINSVPFEYQLDPAMQGEVFGCDLVVEVLSISFVKDCPFCERDQSGDPVTVTVQNNITIDFNTNPPTYSGDPVLQPYVTYDTSGPTPDTWKAIFDLEGKALIIKSGATIKTQQVGTGNQKYAPGIVIKSRCTLDIEDDAGVVVTSLNRNAGDILLQFDGDMQIDGLVHNEVTGTLNLPGKVTIASKCGDITEGRSGLVQVLGIANGGNDINILACQKGNITTNGLVMSRAKARTQPVTQNRPNINVAAFHGSVTINATGTIPLFDEYDYAGTTYDLWGGLLSWVTENINPGSIKVQAEHDIIVNGHGHANRRSFGAVAAVTNTNDTHGGIIDTRSTNGSIVARDRAFDVSGRNQQNPNIAAIRLAAAKALSFIRFGADTNFNPEVDASASGGNSRGGVNTIRAYQESITNGANALISALATGSNSVHGANNLTSCTGVVNAGAISPADGNAGDDTATCSQLAPDPLWAGCELFLPQ
ncbi:MAG: hypothetical protein A3J54_00345 [Candidatus Ryanbacteria bacterium RIFCSPHIGHO2_02_FULL_45_13b]|uniref:Uncharacterized protein n=1 Tax=Candidatus Ryanbacteria bacterium RIFCSPHIGHO2_02_FULL_45_13b TaxID=1802117 RepID=A0A1G2G4K0_9BACT|nr:MAG: hypothetical protein A3J54_00345 [Candidatus Ryanbacteria bacterium RIFCSPHIGHO2_02_FULL_45_13b]